MRVCIIPYLYHHFTSSLQIKCIIIVGTQYIIRYYYQLVLPLIGTPYLNIFKYQFNACLNRVVVKAALWCTFFELETTYRQFQFRRQRNIRNHAQMIRSDCVRGICPHSTYAQTEHDFSRNSFCEL